MYVQLVGHDKAVVASSHQGLQMTAVQLKGLSHIPFRAKIAGDLGTEEVGLGANTNDLFLGHRMNCRF